MPGGPKSNYDAMTTRTRAAVAANLALSAAAQFANAHPLIVAALLLAIAIGLIGLAVLGAVSLVKMLIAI
jgi:hypothetical protein